MTVPRFPAVLALLLLLAFTAGDTRAAEEARFTSGLYLRVDGVMRTLYIEGPSLVAPRVLYSTEATVSVDIDAEILLGKHEAGRGRHQLTLFLDPAKTWQFALGGASSRRQKRQDLTMTEDAPRERELHVRFARTGRPRELKLLVAWGTRRGAIEVIVDPGARTVVPTATGLDVAKLREERGLLLAAVGDLLDAMRARGRWIGMLAAIRDAAIGPGRPRGVILRELAFDLSDSSLSLTGKGQTPGDVYDEVGEFRERLQNGNLSSCYTRIVVTGGDRIRGANDSTIAHPFTIQAESSPEQWRPRRVEIAPAAGGDAGALAEEVAFLDEWLCCVADPGRKKGVTNIRDRIQALLDLRMETGMVVLPDPSPFERRDGDLLGYYRVEMTVRGPMEGLLRFLDGVHGWGTPVRLAVVKILEGEDGIEARITFEFLSYEPLKDHAPRLSRAIHAIQHAEDFNDRLAVYLKRFPTVPPYERYPRREKLEEPFRAGAENEDDE